MFDGTERNPKLQYPPPAEAVAEYRLDEEPPILGALRQLESRDLVRFRHKIYQEKTCQQQPSYTITRLSRFNPL